MSDYYESERERMIQLALKNPKPCLICQSEEVSGVGTWIPDSRHRLAAGGTGKNVPIFAFWLCREHGQTSDTGKKIRQAILRLVRIGGIQY